MTGAIFDVQTVYEVTSKYYALIPPVACAFLFVIDAPFGRFALKNSSILQLDGIKSWVVMELVSPIVFLYTFLSAPFLSSTPSFFSKFSASSGSSSISIFRLTPTLLTLSKLSSHQLILAALFLTHYANRAILSPLRTPARSRSHIIVVAAAIVFNTVNGSLMGLYLSSSSCRTFLDSTLSTHTGQLRFWGGVALWAVGLVGNIVHDEILLNIRRKQKSAGHKKDSSKDVKGSDEKPHYAIPHGLLYSFISYPNYFCEWVEWIGFALAAAPIPVLFTPHVSRLFSPLTPHTNLLSNFSTDVKELVDTYAKMTPPWLFVSAEIVLMAPRAWRGHLWYKQKFPKYPRERRAVVPFLF